MANDKLTESYDPSVAKTFMESNALASGLPGFLGLRFVEFSPGRLAAEMEVRPHRRVAQGTVLIREPRSSGS